METSTPSIIEANELAMDCLGLHYDNFDSINREESNLPERIAKAGSYYELKDLPLSGLPEESEFDIDDDKVEEFAALTTPFPPIVVGKDGEVIDGGHRLLAARKRGDTTLPVYVPLTPKAARAHHTAWMASRTA
jgi:hypothetical protein